MVTFSLLRWVFIIIVPKKYQNHLWNLNPFYINLTKTNLHNGRPPFNQTIIYNQKFQQNSKHIYVQISSNVKTLWIPFFCNNNNIHCSPTFTQLFVSSLHFTPQQSRVIETAYKTLQIQHGRIHMIQFVTTLFLK